MINNKYSCIVPYKGRHIFLYPCDYRLYFLKGGPIKMSNTEIRQLLQGRTILVNIKYYYSYP